MKLKKQFFGLLLFTAALISFSANAQYGQGYGGGRMGSGGMAVPQAGSGVSGRKADKPDYVEQTVTYYTKELTLDDFQAAAVREVLKDNVDKLTNLMMDTSMTDAEKKDRAGVVNDKIDADIERMLSAEQKEKYEALKKKRNKH